MNEQKKKKENLQIHALDAHITIEFTELHRTHARTDIWLVLPYGNCKRNCQNRESFSFLSFPSTRFTLNTISLLLHYHYNLQHKNDNEYFNG